VAMSIEQKEFASYVVDLMQSIGPVTSKYMFGGVGIFLEGLMFGLIADNELYLKVDEDNLADFEELGLSAFSFAKDGKEFKMGYFQAPEEAMEDIEMMNQWATKAYGAAIRAAAKKKPKQKKKK